METDLVADETLSWRRGWYPYWIWGPIVAFAVSWIFGVAIFLAYPVFLAISQYIALKDFQSIKRGWLLLIYGLISCCGIFAGISEYLKPSLIDFTPLQHLTLIFYGSQCLTELLFPLIFRKWRLGYWTLGNSVALICWLFISFLFPAKENFWNAHLTFFILPLLAVLPNAITGYFLHLATRPDSYETV